MYISLGVTCLYTAYLNSLRGWSAPLGGFCMSPWERQVFVLCAAPLFCADSLRTDVWLMLWKLPPDDFGPCPFCCPGCLRFALTILRLLSLFSALRLLRLGPFGFGALLLLFWTFLSNSKTFHFYTIRDG